MLCSFIAKKGEDNLMYTFKETALLISLGEIDSGSFPESKTVTQIKKRPEERLRKTWEY